jgi:hypothetical protein
MASQRQVAMKHYFMRGGILLMDHDAVVRQKMTERYLLNELDPAAKDEFEEHFFDCRDCALDVRAGAMFVEQSKVALAENSAERSRPIPMPVSPVPVHRRWLARLAPVLRPAFTVPIFSLLLAVIGYQNLVTYPHLQQALNTPQVLPWTSVNVGTYGSEAQVIKSPPEKNFLLFMRIPPNDGYSQYTAELYNAAGKVAWSLTVPATPGQDQWAIKIPGGNREAGNYILKVRGLTATGESKEVGQASFELQIQK